MLVIFVDKLKKKREKKKKYKEMKIEQNIYNFFVNYLT